MSKLLKQKGAPSKRFVVSGCLSLILLVVLSLCAASYSIFKKVSSFYEHNTITFNKPIEFNTKVNELWTISPRVEKIVIEKPQDLEETIESFGEKKDVAKYICDKWGVTECKTALAVAKAESGMREEAINVNTNGSIDVGIYQVNSIHYDKEGCSLKDVVDAYKNVDCAYEIWKGRGWNAWAAYNNSSYLAQLEKK